MHELQQTESLLSNERKKKPRKKNRERRSPPKDETFDMYSIESWYEGGMMKKSDKVWIWYALGAGLFFSLTNVAISEINDGVGILSSMYLTVGAIISSSVYFIQKGSKNKRQGLPWWTS